MKRGFYIIGSLISWFSVITQFIIMFQNRQADVLETIIRFFSFFTILTNTLIAVFFTVRVFNLKERFFSIFFKQGVITALTVFILVVGIVYQIILRKIWEPTGLQMIVDELLHTIIPLYVLLYWFLYATKEDLMLLNIKKWIWYPIIYFVYIVVRGYFSGFYPYPFANVSVIGYKQLAINFILIIIFIVFLSVILIVVGRKLKQKPM